MVALTWSCEGTDGATVTTGNSGMDAIAIGTGGTTTYDAANKLFGSTCVKVTTGTGTATEAAWSTQLGTVTTLYARWYLKLGFTPGANNRLFQGMCAGSQSGFGFDLSTTRTLITKDAGNGTWGTTAAIPLNQWVRVEMDVPAFSTTTGAPVLRLYLSPHSTTADSTISGTNRNIGANCTFFRLPIRTASWGPIYYDEIKLDTAAQPGPLPDPTAVQHGQFFPFLT